MKSIVKIGLSGAMIEVGISRVIHPNKRLPGGPAGQKCRPSARLVERTIGLKNSLAVLDPGRDQLFRKTTIPTWIVYPE